MSETLALLHTVSGLVPTFGQLCQELLPEAEVFHMLDESLLKNTIRSGHLTPTTARRVVGHVASAEEAGADVVLVTCTSIGAAVEMARSLVGVPVVRVDEAMADEAVRRGRRIGVAATLRTTLEPTTDLLRRRAAAAGGETRQVVPHLCQGAFEALGAGDSARHDAAVADGLRTLMAQVDVIVLAQASMARVAQALPASDQQVPILSSPRSGVQRAADVLHQR
ncbi:MAG: aspartate/glutamate racemase family protein [Chloroflexi bacterium]|nr:aspartate/glutamate racemase family protein [Chloroflexota bacterium]